jgi:16S rRNA (adenine1518-N6/adenine1519-N6)-dimethyltransferase
MKIFKPSELQAFLKELGVHAKSGLSQNFLIDGNIIQKIVQTASISSDDFIIEIGPGPGALTEALLEKGASVTAIEMDPNFANALHRLQTNDQRLHVVNMDVLEFPLIELLKNQKKKCKVVANLPYHITTPILTRLLPLYSWLDSLTIMVQKEFAERMIAEKGTENYSSFSVFLQFYSSIQSSFTVSPNCFFPRPKVFSSVVHCKLHPPLMEKNVEAFFQLTRTAFGHRRKMLRSSLKELYGATEVEQALVKIGHPLTERPEELSVREFISLFEILNASF